MLLLAFTSGKTKPRVWNAKHLGLLKYAGQPVFIKAQVKYGMQRWDTNILPMLLLKQTNQLVALPHQTKYIIY